MESKGSPLEKYGRHLGLGLLRLAEGLDEPCRASKRNLMSFSGAPFSAL